MDRTQLYRQIIIAANPDAAALIEPATGDEPELDQLTRDCTDSLRRIMAIRKFIKDVRPQYLVVAGSDRLSGNERDTVDYEVRRMLLSARTFVEHLEAAEQQRVVGLHSRKFASFVRNRQVTGLNDTLARHRQGMFICINQMLKFASDELADMKKGRLSREVSCKKQSTEYSSSRSSSSSLPQTLASMRPNTTVSTVFPTCSTLQVHDEEHKQRSTNCVALSELTEQESQILLQENQSLFSDLQSRLGTAQKAEKSLRDIAMLQTELAAHLEAQTSVIDSLVDDVFQTTTDITGANKQLESARHRNKRASRVIVFTALGLALLLLYMDAR